MYGDLLQASVIDLLQPTQTGGGLASFFLAGGRKGLLSLDHFDPLLTPRALKKAAAWPPFSGGPPPMTLIFIITPAEATVILQGWLEMVGKEDGPLAPPPSTVFSIFCVGSEDEGGLHNSTHSRNSALGLLQRLEEGFISFGCTPLLPSRLGGAGEDADPSFSLWVSHLLLSLRSLDEKIWENSAHPQARNRQDPMESFGIFPPTTPLVGSASLLDHALLPGSVSTALESEGSYIMSPIFSSAYPLTSSGNVRLLKTAKRQAPQPREVEPYAGVPISPLVMNPLRLGTEGSPNPMDQQGFSPLGYAPDLPPHLRPRSPRGSL